MSRYIEVISDTSSNYKVNSLSTGRKGSLISSNVNIGVFGDAVNVVVRKEENLSNNDENVKILSDTSQGHKLNFLSTAEKQSTTISGNNTGVRNNTTNVVVKSEKRNLNKNKLNTSPTAETWQELKTEGIEYQTFINMYTDTDKNSLNYNVLPQTEAWVCAICSFKNTRSRFLCDMCSVVINVGISHTREPLSQEALADKHWKYIIRYCKFYNTCFTDQMFPPSLSSIFQHQEDNDNNDIQWERIRNVKLSSEDEEALMWTVFRNPTSSDVQQRFLSHCWLMSAMAILAENQHLLLSLLITKEYCKEGAYQVRIFYKGRWTVLIIDDLFPCNRLGELIFSPPVRKQLWPLLLEKAAAKCHGCYEALNYGYLADGFIMLTGAPCDEKFVAEYENEFDLLLVQLLSAKEAGFLIGALTHIQFCDTAPTNGLEEEHIYSLLDIKINEIGYLQMRDPSGDLSDIKNVVGNKCDSTFWIPFDYAMKMFVSFTICKIRPNWHEIRFDGDFLPLCTKYHCSYLLEVGQITEVDLMLHRHIKRTLITQRAYLIDTCIAIYRVDFMPNTIELIADTYRWKKFYTHCNAILKPGKYIVYPLSLTVNEKTPIHYTLSIHSSRKLSAEIYNDCSMREALMTLTLTRGTEMESTLKYVKIYCLREQWQGITLMVDNLYHNKWIRIQLKFTNVINLVSTRGSFETEDYLAPHHRQIINILTVIQYPVEIDFMYAHHPVSAKKVNFNDLHLPRLQHAIHSPQIISE